MADFTPDIVPVRPTALKPGYLAALFAVLAVVLGAFALYGLQQERRSTLETMERGARSLAEAVSRAEENVLRAEADMEALVGERLLDNARLLAELGSRQALSDTLIERLAAEHELDQVDVLDLEGRLLASSGIVDDDELDGWQEGLQRLFAGLEQALLFELDQRLFAVAVAMRNGGVVIVRASAERLLELRIRSGAGRLIQEIGSNKGVVYMVLQDSLGVLAASSDVVLIDPITGDTFLESALVKDSVDSRLVTFEGQQIFEAVIPFAPEGETLGLLRIGLSLDELRVQERRGRLQVLLLVLLLLVLGAVGAGAVTVRQNLSLLGDAYTRIQTYSSRILTQMADAVIATDPVGVIEVFNQAAEDLLGGDRNEVRGRRLQEDWPHEIVDGALQGEELLGAVCLYTNKEGGERTLAVSSSQVRNADGEVETIVLVVQDLSEKVAMEADLRRRDRLASMGALAAGVAHEVRNPLNAISVIVQRLRREFIPQQDKEEYGQLTGVVSEEVKRVNRIIEQFLELARPPALAKERADLAALLQRAAQTIEPRVLATGLRLQRDFNDVGAVEVDADQLQQALLNLLGNAIESMESMDEEAIKLAARSLADGWVEITVADTGPGIPPAELERIFDLYFTTKAEGTGLGLSIVHRIVSEHGGRIEVQSALGEGTRFTILLPRGC